MLKIAKLKKDELQQTIENVIKGLNPSEAGKGFSYYAGLYPAGISEYTIAKAVPQFPELHPLMVQLVQKVVDFVDYPIWVDDEEQGGCLVSFALALYDKKYCELFAECLVNQDLDHEVNQNDYIQEVFEKWGACKETALLVAARINNSGQHGPEIVGDMLSEYEDLSDYLEGLIDEEDEESSFYADEEDVLAPSVSIEQIEKAKSEKQLMKYYTDGMVDFIREFGTFVIEALNSYKKNNKEAVAILLIHIDADNNAIEFSIEDTKGNKKNAYSTVKPRCLLPFAKICSKLDYNVQEKIKELTALYIIPSITSGAVDKGTVTKSFKIEIG